MTRAKLKQRLDDIYKTYHHPDFLGRDPLVCVRRFASGGEREIVGLAAASLAYGRVEIIIKNINKTLYLIKDDPVGFVNDTTYSQKLKALAPFKHRFNDGADIAALFESVKMILREYGTLENCFRDCMEQHAQELRPALTQFAELIKDNGRAHCGDRQSFNYLISSPRKGGACKRVLMFLRWMIREDDGIDFGIWKSVPASCLLIPVDTHVAQIARELGMTKRNTADWIMSEEITDVLREFDPNDPVKYDFSLCRAGMLKFRGL